MEQQNTSSVMYYNLYPSEYYVIHNGNSYTKHVYMDGERVATLLGSDNSLLDNYSNSSITLAGTPFITGNVSQHYAAKRTTKESDLINSLEEVFGYTYSLTDLQNTITYSGAQVTDLPYYFHRDHLGSAALVTDSVGNVDHRMEYTPDGSLFFQTVTGNYRTPYRFNAKEFDDDTELYYFGARYYDKNLGIWISPDPMAEDYPGVSSYAYCHGNPVNRIDLWGMDDYTVNKDGYIRNTTSLWEKIKKIFGKNNGIDRIFLEGYDKPLLTFPEGTISYVENGKDYSKLEIENEKYAEKTFQTLIDNSDVEWAHIRHNNNKVSSSLIINNHDDKDVTTSVSFAEMYKNRGETISLYEHSHPLFKEYKKYGLPNLPPKFPPSNDDIETAKKYPKTLLKVYDIYNNKIYEYDKNGTKKTYKR